MATYKHSTMSNRALYKAWVLFGILLIAAIPDETQAQFLDLRLDIDSKISARTEQSLNFGTLMTNSGRTEIKANQNNIGIFSITALEHQLLLVSMDMPDELLHVSASVTDVVPVELQARYGYSYQDYEHSYPLPSPAGSVFVEESSSVGPWNSVYFFIYGSVVIGDIAGGIYSNEIILNVEYL